MSTLKVNTIQSYTTTFPLEIKDNVSSSGAFTASKFEILGGPSITSTGVTGDTGSFNRIKLGTAVFNQGGEQDFQGGFAASGIVSSSNSGSFNYVSSATKVKTENLHVGTNHSSPYNQSIGTIFQTSSTDNLKIIVEKLPRISGIIGVSQLLLSTGSLFTVSGSQLPFSGSTAQMNYISSSLFMMVATHL